ncbi:MAG: response regulator [Bacteroidota bacterium]
MLADDHRMFREALLGPLGNEPDICVVAEAGTGGEALAAVLGACPDVLVLDINLPDMSGIEVARQVRQQQPATHVVILSGYAERVFVEESFKAGAQAYVVKSAGADELVMAIRAAAQGSTFLSGEISSMLLRNLGADQKSPPPISALTQREMEILTLIAAGMRAAGIGVRLGIAASTVEAHRRNLKQKLSLRTAADLTRYAIRAGLLPA